MFPAPTAEVHSAQNDFAISPAQVADLVNHLGGRRAAAAATHERDNAKRTPVVAAVLDLEIGTGAITQRILCRSGKELLRGENIADVNLAVIRQVSVLQEFGDLNLVGISDDHRYAGESGDLLGGTRRVATGDDDAGIRILTMDAMDGLAEVVVRSLRNSASIQHHKLRVAGFG